jgi:endonuclease-3
MIYTVSVEVDRMISEKQRALEVYRRLEGLSPAELGFLTAARMGPYQLLIATILSAQTTDRQVNMVTDQLFAAFPTPPDLAAAELEHIEQIIKSTGFYHVKARNIKAAAAMLVQRFNGEVPSAMDELTTIPGVGRKTASVVLGHIFHKPAIIVDTHFSRVIRRLGFSESRYPETIEREVAALIPPDKQYRFSMMVNYHGRMVCQSRKPSCGTCVLCDICCGCLISGDVGQ